MLLSTFLQCLKYRMRAIHNSNSIFKRIAQRNAIIISGYLLLNSVRKSRWEDIGKLLECVILYLIHVKILINQFHEHVRLKMSRV